MWFYSFWASPVIRRLLKKYSIFYQKWHEIAYKYGLISQKEGQDIKKITISTQSLYTYHLHFLVLVILNLLGSHETLIFHVAAVIWRGLSMLALVPVDALGNCRGTHTDGGVLRLQVLVADALLFVSKGTEIMLAWLLGALCRIAPGGAFPPVS